MPLDREREKGGYFLLIRVNVNVEEGKEEEEKKNGRQLQVVKAANITLISKLK